MVIVTLVLLERDVELKNQEERSKTIIQESITPQRRLEKTNNKQSKNNNKERRNLTNYLISFFFH